MAVIFPCGMERLGVAENWPRRLFNKNTGPCSKRKLRYRG